MSYADTLAELKKLKSTGVGSAKSDKSPKKRIPAEVPLAKIPAETTKRTLYVVTVDHASFIYVDHTSAPLSHIRRRMRQKFGPSRVKSVKPKGEGPLTGNVCDRPDCRLCKQDLVPC